MTCRTRVENVQMAYRGRVEDVQTSVTRAYTWRAEGVPELISASDFPLGASMTTKIAAIADEIDDLNVQAQEFQVWVGRGSDLPLVPSPLEKP